MNEWELNKVFNESVKNIDGNLIVLGDFNTGPDIINRNVSAEIPANYPQIENLGKDDRELFRISSVANMTKFHVVSLKWR